MSAREPLWFSAFGPKARPEYKEQLFPFNIGRISANIPGSTALLKSAAMDAGSGGFVYHFKINEPASDPIFVNGLNRDPDGLLCVMVTMAGGGEMKYDGVKESVIHDLGSVALVTCREDFMRATMAPGVAQEVCGFTCLGPFILHALEGERAPRFLKEAAQAGRIDKSSLAMRYCTPYIMRIAREAASHPYHGAAERIFLQSKMLELLAELTMADPDGGKTSCKPVEALYGKACHARDILLMNPQNPPDSMELGRMVGASYRTINRAFMKYFNRTAYRFARDAALDHARKMLEETDTTVSEAAYNCGYSHPSAFITAYKRRFGQPPGRQKRGGGKG